MLLLPRLKAPTPGTKGFNGNPAISAANRCAKRDKESLVSQRFIEQIQLVSHIVDLHFAVVFRNYLI